MTFKSLAALLCALVCTFAGDALGQSSINPDISAIGDIRGSWTSDDRDPGADQFNLELHEAEIAFQGYLNPYARADAFVGFHDGEGADIEEMYLTFTRGLPLGLSVRVGQYLMEFGKLNSLHPHAYSFILAPLPNVAFFGEEGLRDVGVHASLPIPTGDLATTLSLDVLKGDFLDEHAHEDFHESESERPNERAFAGRLQTFVAIDDFRSISFGATAVTGVPAVGTRRWIWGGDVKFRWKPDRYRSLTIIGEYTGNRQPTEEHLERTEIASAQHGDGHEYSSRHGAFGYVDYQFRQRFNIGAMCDWLQVDELRTGDSWRIGGFVGFAPVEETSLLRFLAVYNNDAHSDQGYLSGVIQLVFSLGPHKPHAF